MEISLIAVAILGLIAFWVARAAVNAQQHWKAFPTLDDYLGQHPDCQTGQGIRCYQCGSGSIKNWGVASADDARRLFICNHCGKKLYRSV